ncbi:MAG: oligoendopeptidase F [Mycoplasmatales bacterium]
MKRADVAIKDTWDLKIMYENEQQVNEDLQKIVELTAEFVKYRNLPLTLENFYQSLEAYFQIERLEDKILTYSRLKLDVKLSDSKNQKFKNMLATKITDNNLELSFYWPMVTEKTEFLESAHKSPLFAKYQYLIEGLIKEKQYILSEKEEKIMMNASKLRQAPSNIFSTLVDIDFKFEDVVLTDGTTKALTAGSYSSFLYNPDQAVRKDAFLKLVKPYEQFNQTLAQIYLSEINRDLFTIRSRGYESTRQAALSQNDVEEKIYDNLLEVINDNLEINHDYLKLRKAKLKLEQLHIYDVYVPLVDDESFEFSYEESQTIILEALKPLGEEYLMVVKKAFQERWIDVYETEDKRSGAYSGGCFDSPPYILMNYTNTINDLFTLIHELGHSVHSYYARKANEYHASDYRIFVAEIASTVNEILLTKYLLKTLKEPAQINFVLNYYLEQFRTTVLRQTMFAEFEYQTHFSIEQNKMLSAEDLNDLYLNLNKRYFGDAVEIDEQIKYEWSRIPHMYYNYYVYQYATSFCVAVDIAEKILEDETMIKKYLEMLKAGGRISPLSTVEIVGIDLRQKAPLENAMKEFRNILEQFAQGIEHDWNKKFNV